MAITKEFLDTVFDGIDNPDERIGKILSEYEMDLTGLKRNNGDLKTEKEKIAKQHKALLEEKAALEASVKELDEKLRGGLPEEQRKHYEVELQSANDRYAALAAEKDNLLAERETEIAKLQAQRHEYLCQSAFNELVNADSSIFQDTRDILRDAFFARNKFKEVEIPGEGRKLLNEGSQSMEKALADFFAAPGGLRFKAHKNSGGGARALK
jgi:predicted  nucleic acid-binding Zn-ribbon protein